MGVGASKRGGDDSLAALLERRAFDVLQQRTDRVMLVLANVTDPAVELQILQCADSMGVQSVFRVERAPHNSQQRVQDYASRAAHHGAVDGATRCLPHLLDIRSFPTAEACIHSLKTTGCAVWALVSPLPAPPGRVFRNRAVQLDAPSLPPMPAKLAIVIGDGLTGCAPEVAAACDLHVCLPESRGFVQHLPTAVSAGLALNLLLSRCPEALGDLPELRRSHLLARWKVSALPPTHPLFAQQHHTVYHPDYSDDTDEMFFDAEDDLGETTPREKLSSPTTRRTWSDKRRYRASLDRVKNERDRHGSTAGPRPVRHLESSVLDWDNVPMSPRSNPKFQASFKSAARNSRDRQRDSNWLDVSWLFGGNGDEGFQQQFGDAAEFGHLSMERDADTPSSRLSQQLGRAVSFSPDTAEMVPSCTSVDGPFHWDTLPDYYPKGFCAHCPPGTFQVRSGNYLSDRVKETAGDPICMLLGADMFRIPSKIDHICQYMKLPVVPPDFMPPWPGLPALLVINLQVPMYEPSLFTTVKDGDGLSCLWFWAIDYSKVQPEAMQPLRRFLQGEREADRGLSTDKLKLILKLANVEEAFEKGGVLQSERHLLNTWNAKPVMSRPTHRFYREKNYLEVDLDIHLWRYLTRKFLLNAPQRFHLLVWDFALVVQTDNADELPEQILASTRMSRITINHAQPFPGHIPDPPMQH